MFFNVYAALAVWWITYEYIYISHTDIKVVYIIFNNVFNGSDAVLYWLLIKLEKKSSILCAHTQVHSDIF